MRARMLPLAVGFSTNPFECYITSQYRSASGTEYGVLLNRVFKVSIRRADINL
jgi:hypothetical protein